MNDASTMEAIDNYVEDVGSDQSGQAGQAGQVDESSESEQDYQDESNESDESDQQDQDSEGSQGQYTEKGTRLDPDPQSALHQQLANERRARIETEEKALRILQAYQQQAVQSQPQAQEKKPLIDVSKLETREDLVNAFEQVENVIRSYEEKIGGLQQQLGQSKEVFEEDRNYSSLEREIGELRKIPELTPGSPQHNQALEAEITQTYKDIAYDSYGRLLPNRPSLASVASRMVNTYRLANKQATRQAQTRTVQKSLGRVQNSNKRGDQVSSENLSPAERLEREMNRLGL